MSLYPVTYVRSNTLPRTTRLNSPGCVAYLSDSVGVSAVGDLGRARAVGLVRGNDLSGVGHIGGSRVGRVTGRDASDQGSSSDSELHFD